VPGSGVPAGGTTDQVIVKQSGTDYDVAWEDQAGGGGGGLKIITGTPQDIAVNDLILDDEGHIHRCISASTSMTTGSVYYPRAGQLWDARFRPVEEFFFRGTWQQGLTGDADMYYPGDVVSHFKQFGTGDDLTAVYGGLFVCVSAHNASFSNDPKTDYGTWTYWYPLQADPWNGAGRESLFIPVSQMDSAVTSGLGTGTYNPNPALTEFGSSTPKTTMWVAWFAAASTERVVCTFGLPESWEHYSENAINIAVHWISDNTDTGDVIWQPYMHAYDHSDVMTLGPGSTGTITSTATGTQYDMHRAYGLEFGAEYISNSDFDTVFNLIMERDSADTYTGNAGLVGVTIYFNKRWNANFDQAL